MEALACAARAEVSFPEPLEHDQDSCPFKRLEDEPIARLAAAIDACSMRRPIIGAVALCHMSPEFRTRLWNALRTPARATIRPALHGVPIVTDACTRTYADQLRLMARRLQRTD